MTRQTMGHLIEGHTRLMPRILWPSAPWQSSLPGWATLQIKDSEFPIQGPSGWTPLPGYKPSGGSSPQKAQMAQPYGLGALGLALGEGSRPLREECLM